MALKLWIGNAGSGKSHLLYEEVIREANAHKDRNYAVIVPEQFTLQTQQDLVRLHPNQGILNIDVLNFTRLAYRVYEEVGFANAPGLLIDDLGKALILKKLARLHEKEFKVLGKNLRKLGYIGEVKSVLAEFMQYGVDDTAIELLKQQSQINNRRLLSEKLDDIQLIYRAFREYISEKYTTSEELLTKVASVLRQSEKLKRTVVVFDGFTGFTPVQFHLIEGLMKQCIDVHLTVLLDVCGKRDVLLPTEEQELFYLSAKTIRELKHLALENGVKVLPDTVITEAIPYRYRKATIADASKELPQMLIHLEKHLFRNETVVCEDVGENGGDADESLSPSSCIRIASAANSLDEMRHVAITMERLIREKGYRYKDMAVVTGDLETYRNAAERVFTMFHIPFFVDKTTPILLNPFVEYLRSILRILTENYSYEGMFGYFRSSLTGFDADEIDLLDNYCIACGIRGKKQWTESFKRCPHTFTQEDLTRMNELRERAMKPFAGFDGAKCVRDYCTALYHMLTEENMQQKLKNRQHDFIKNHDHIRAKEYEQIYKHVMDLLNKLVALLGDEEMDFEEFAELLDAGFNELRIGVVPAQTDYVQVGDLTRSRFRDIRALFFVGVNEGVVPAANSGTGILSDLDREFLKSSGISVELAPTARMRAYTQRLYLYLVMCKPTERLYLSYARVADDGSAMNASYLIGLLKEMFPTIVEHAYEELRFTDRIYSEENGLQELAYGLQDYILAGNKTEFTTDYHNLYQYYAGEGTYAKELETLVNSAFSMGVMSMTDSVSESIAHVIYGKTLQGSVTRLEKYATCAYAYFLQYGLRLSEREEFSFEMNDMGSVFHQALENYGKLLKAQNMTWFDPNEEETAQLVDQSIREAVSGFDAINATCRSFYAMERMKRILRRTVSVLTDQLKAGEFIPAEFELSFFKDSDLRSIRFRLSEEEMMQLSGQIDRVDLYREENRIYVKIIDYKSGEKDFNLAAVYRGEQLQLVVYLNAAMEMLAKKYPKHQVLPAGILYYHLDDPLVEATASDTDDAIQQKIREALCMKGLVVADGEIARKMDHDAAEKSSVIPVKFDRDGSLHRSSKVASEEEFRIVSDYVTHVITNMGKQILQGNIQATARNCKYCIYQTVCHVTNRADETREKTMSKEEAVTAMAEAIGAAYSERIEPAADLKPEHQGEREG